MKAEVTIKDFIQEGNVAGFPTSERLYRWTVTNDQGTLTGTTHSSRSANRQVRRAIRLIEEQWTR